MSNETTENINPLWNADYAKVHFTYRPSGGIRFNNQDLVVFGELTNYGKDPSAVMDFNEEKGIYETDLFLKQGYYDYQYATKEIFKPTIGALLFIQIERILFQNIVKPTQKRKRNIFQF